MSAGKKNKGVEYTSMNRVKLIIGGKPYFDCLLQMIRNASESIHLQTYIFDDDETGQLVANALKVAAKRKVRVYLLTDGFASKGMSRAFIHSLQEAGVQFRFFDPLLKSRYFYFGRRLHHKVAVTDGTNALVGGVNIANRYNDMPGKPAWLDFALYIEGEAAKQLCVLCWKTWNNYPLSMSTTPCEQKEISFAFLPDERCDVSMRRNDWVRRKNEISSTYVDMLRKAQSHIIILCSYFLPGPVIRRHLADAAKRGVAVKIVIAGISDLRITKHAERYIYDWLLRNNIELYEYQPTVLHGKIAVCDSKWVTIGSYNINNLSAYASIELNMNVRNTEFAKQTESTLQQIIDSDCMRITPQWWRQSENPALRLLQWFSHQFIRLSLNVFTFYYRHKS